jgi:hypothetical protein
MALIERIAAAWAVLVEIFSPTSAPGGRSEDSGWWDRPGIPGGSSGSRAA